MEQMMGTEQCPVCGNQAQLKPTNKDAKYFSCPQCGDYEISRTALAATGEWEGVKRHLLSAYIRKEYDSGNILMITTDDLPRFKTAPEMPLVEKIDALLLEFAKDLDGYNQTTKLNNKKYIAKTQAKSEKEYHYILRILTERKFVHVESTKGTILMLPDGWIQADLLRKKQTDFTQAFIAMWFDPSMDEIYKKGIKPAFDGTGMKPFLVSQKKQKKKKKANLISIFASTI